MDLLTTWGESLTLFPITCPESKFGLTVEVLWKKLKQSFNPFQWV
ncbi:hypothetical protein OsccyDRAFT_0922 [Leptolyngbyaceae cyanobacterium JSC-12]|nr:hypothetical protein OsccyDRAFT_0922 [Leptolyngbyaceae cyanobacterium JSC-12]